MLKKIAKRITWEVNQAEDYVTQAYLVKLKCPDLASVFIELASEEIAHAKRLFKKGNELIENGKITELDDTMTETQIEIKEAIWEWEYRVMMERVAELEYKIVLFRR